MDKTARSLWKLWPVVCVVVCCQLAKIKTIQTTRKRCGAFRPVRSSTKGFFFFLVWKYKKKCANRGWVNLNETTAKKTCRRHSPTWYLTNPLIHFLPASLPSAWTLAGGDTESEKGCLVSPLQLKNRHTYKNSAPQLRLTVPKCLHCKLHKHIHRTYSSGIRGIGGIVRVHPRRGASGGSVRCRRQALYRWLSFNNVQICEAKAGSYILPRHFRTVKCNFWVCHV